MKIPSHMATAAVSMHAQEPIGTVEFALEARVRDRWVREHKAEFNGYEKVFAWAPQDVGGTKWKRIDLDFQRTLGPEAHASDPIDVHVAVTRLDAQAVLLHGVAFGMETNTGTIWFQEAGDNYRPCG